MFPSYPPMAHSSPHPSKVAPSSLKGCKTFEHSCLTTHNAELTAPTVTTSNCADDPLALTDASSTSTPPRNLVDMHFHLPPALITCFVRHTNAHHQLLATPAIVEWCLRDLQRQLMQGVPVERVFGPTVPATMPMNRRTYSATPSKDKIFTAPLNSSVPPPINTPNAGSYLAGSRVRLQLAKTTDILNVASGTSALHLLIYAVDELESKPAVVAQIAQDWRAALMRKGEGDDCLVLLVHSDLIAAAEEASRLAEEAQQSSGQSLAAVSKSPVPTTKEAGLSIGGSAASAPAVSQARVDAAAAQLRKYYKELRDVKFLPQQMCAYMPNETLLRILERLRSAFLTHGARLRQGFEACAARKRRSPQDPWTTPGAPVSATGPRIDRSTSCSRTLQQPPAGGPLSPSPPEAQKYWSVQEFWRCGFDLAVHYLQYGLVFDARAVLERLFLEYYNSSDDYNFMRTPVETLQRLGQVPNLFDTNRYADWEQSRSGYPKGLSAGAELLDGLLLITAAEMTCSLLLGDTTAAMTRYQAFMQVTQEKFDEWSTANPQESPSTAVSSTKAADGRHRSSSLNFSTFQQFFLLQCYLSGLRLWWPASGLCRSRREATTATGTTPPQRDQPPDLIAEKSSRVRMISPVSLSPTKTRAAICTATANLSNHSDNRDHDRLSQESAATSNSLSPILRTAADNEKVISMAPVSGADPAQLGLPTLVGNGVRYSITNLSFTAATASEGQSAARQDSVGRKVGNLITEPTASALAGPHAGIPSEADSRRNVEATVCNGGLNYLLESCEDTVESATTHLIDLAISTGLLPQDTVAQESLESVQAMRDALTDGDAEAMWALQQHQRHIRQICVEAASLLEKARDALAAVAQDLGYGHLSYPVSLTAGAASRNQGEPGHSDVDKSEGTAAPSFLFSNVEELSSPEKALGLWRVLTMMAALSLRIGEQRRREQDLYAQLAVTFLIDQPNVTANIVSERLLPSTNRRGWRQIELFVRRLYVEARERLMRSAGLVSPSRTTAMVEPQSERWLCVFPTSADYALYRECTLELLSSSGCGGVATEDVIEFCFDKHLFSPRPMVERWRELLWIDTLVIGTIFEGEPCEYPLEHFSSSFMVKVDHKAPTTITPDSKEDRVAAIKERSGTVSRGVLKANVNDVVQISIVAWCVIDPLARPAFPGAAEETRGTLEAKPEARFQLTLESRKDWSDEDEVTHEVSICGADAVYYDGQTHHLRVVFTFPVCHAGLYRLRCLRLCNGSIWLSYYPQSNTSGRGGDPTRWTLFPNVSDWYAPSTQIPARLIAEPLYQPVGRSPLLRVPQPRSSVHLQLHLPKEAHCFADSVDYVTLDVELEDPLPIGAPAPTAASADGLGSVTSTHYIDVPLGRGLGAAPGKQGNLAEANSLCSPAECICSYKNTPGSLFLPLSPGRTGGESTQPAPNYFPATCWLPLPRGAEIRSEGLPRQNVSYPHTSRNRLPPSLGDDEFQRKGNEAHTHPSTLRLLGAVVIGTPNVYRPRSSVAAASAMARSTLGASLLNFSMVGHGSAPSGVVVPGGVNSSTLLGLSSSFSLRTLQPVDSLSLTRRGGAPPRSPAPGYVSSMSFGDVPEPLRPGTAGRSARYKSVFRSLRLSNPLELTETTATVEAPMDQNSLQQQQQQEQQQQQTLPRTRRPSKAPPSSLEGGAPGRVAATGNDKIGGDLRGNRSVAASVHNFGLPAILGEAATTPVPSLLHKVSEGVMELVLVHADTVIQEDRSGTAPSHTVRTVASALTAARTVVPIHLRSFLKDPPAPELQWTDSTKSDTMTARTPQLRAESCVPADPPRETVIRFFVDDTDSEKDGSAITHMRLRLPLLPLLSTPIPTKALESPRPETVTSARGVEEDPAPSAAVAANQARISFTCVRGDEPCTTTLSAVFPFQPAIHFDYAFKHFQGRVYCLVKMRNLLTSTSLWLRGAVLRVLDAEPSYEIVRVCEVYNELLFREWKPQEELSILYELDLIASFHPAQPECTHQVQMEVLYSSWYRTFVTTPPEDRLVLRTVELPPTEITAESVEVLHNEMVLDTSESSASESAIPPLSAQTTAAAAAARSIRSVSASRSSSSSSPGDRDRDHARRRSTVSRSSGMMSQTTTSGAVHFNTVTLRHLEETCNTIWGPVATFRSKHLCVFSIVMYAESPWTMRFGAATNYVAQPPSTPLSLNNSAGTGAPLPRHVIHSLAPTTAAPHPSSPSSFSSSFHGAPQNHWSICGGTADGDTKPGATASLFGNAIVDPPSDFVFVAGEPVRFCVRLQPQAQNWPEDAGMEENFFIRLKYNPEQWMVIGKQRDRRTLSLMEEVTVYFNAVPLLPPTSSENDSSPAKSSEPTPVEKAIGSNGGKVPPARVGAAARKGSEEDTDEDEAVDTATGTGRRQRRSVRPLAGHAVKDEGILQTPTVEMFWESKQARTTGVETTDPSTSRAFEKDISSAAEAETDTSAADGPQRCADAVMGDAVLVDVVQFRTWVRVRKRNH